MLPVIATRIAALLIIARAVPLPALEAPHADALWQRAVAVVEANLDWTPGITDLLIQERNGRGQVKKTYRIKTRSSPGPDGETQSELLLHMENDRDVTEKKRAERRKPADGGGGGSRGGMDILDSRNTPFHPGSQDAVRVQRRPQAELIGSRWSTVYDFEQILSDDSRSVGTVWLDSKTGAPLRLRTVPEPMPAMVRDAYAEATYTHTPLGEWYIARIQLAGTLVILFVKRGFFMDMSFGSHWRTAPATGSAE